MLLEIILGILLFISWIIFIIIKIVTNKSIQRFDVPANSPIFQNPCRRQYTNGYYEGIIKTQLPRKNGCTLVEFYPTDVKQGELIPRPEIQSVIVKNEFLKHFSEGELSSCRNYITAIGRSPLDYPEKMRDTDEGKWMTKEGQKAWLVSTFGAGIPNGDEALAEMIKEWARGNMTQAELSRMKELLNEKTKLMLQQPREEKKEENK